MEIETEFKKYQDSEESIAHFKGQIKSSDILINLEELIMAKATQNILKYLGDNGGKATMETEDGISYELDVVYGQLRVTRIKTI